MQNIAYYIWLIGKISHIFVIVIGSINPQQRNNYRTPNIIIRLVRSESFFDRLQ